MSVTNRQRARRWLVWELEYPDDGATAVKARTRHGAAVAYMRATEFGYDPDALGVAQLTAGLAKLRRRNG